VTPEGTVQYVSHPPPQAKALQQTLQVPEGLLIIPVPARVGEPSGNSALLPPPPLPPDTSAAENAGVPPPPLDGGSTKLNVPEPSVLKKSPDEPSVIPSSVTPTFDQEVTEPSVFNTLFA
jgi:hypothetical protein